MLSFRSFSSSIPHARVSECDYVKIDFKKKSLINLNERCEKLRKKDN